MVGTTALDFTSSLKVLQQFSSKANAEAVKIGRLCAQFGQGLISFVRRPGGVFVLDDKAISSWHSICHCVTGAGAAGGDAVSVSFGRRPKAFQWSTWPQLNRCRH